MNTQKHKEEKKRQPFQKKKTKQQNRTFPPQNPRKTLIQVLQGKAGMQLIC